VGRNLSAQKAALHDVYSLVVPKRALFQGEKELRTHLRMHHEFVKPVASEGVKLAEAASAAKLCLLLPASVACMPRYLHL